MAKAQLGEVRGTIKDDKGNPISGVQVNLSNSKYYIFTDSLGFFSLKTTPQSRIFVSFSHISYNAYGEEFSLLLDQVKTLSIKLKSSSEIIDTVVIKEKKKEKLIQEIAINSKLLNKVVSASDDALSLVKSLPGVASSSELSSSYSVRGGNFDENLIYVNGIEVYRPFLIRNGEQEGLSFVNSDLVQNITFSAGGFDAKYGDKLSSVLDIQYREPKDFKASFNLSLLGGKAHIENKVGDKFTYIMGARYKTNSYLLGTLDTKAEYNPRFFDYQTYLTYRPTSKIKFGFLGNISSNRYEMTPVSRQTTFGGINQAFQLNVSLDGNEINRFDAYFGAVSMDVQASEKAVLKFSASVFNTSEEETYDVVGAYSLGELETNLASENAGEVSEVVGTGSFLNHTRNFLKADIFNFTHNGNLTWKPGKLLWGASYQHERFKDDLLEWKYVDSADYSIPLGSDSAIELPMYIQSNNQISTNRIMTYVQNNWTLLKNSDSKLTLNTGIRSNWWDYSEQLLFSPRVSLLFSPSNLTLDSIGNSVRKKRQITYRLAWGYYYQPPFYRELRNLQGQVMSEVKAQKSIHYVGGVDFDFKMWQTPFTWRTEGFYKELDQLIPFEIDNVRLKYFGENSGKGYATGLESRINGEFVNGLESWFSCSFLKTEEKIDNFTYTEYYNVSGEKIINNYTVDTKVVDSVKFNPGYLPRPTDQRFSFKLFFQDRMPKFPAFKVSLNFVYASGMPFGPTGSVKGRSAFRIPAYRRVDIGFSYDIIEDGKLRKGKKLVDIPQKHLLRAFHDFWIRAEVFNLLDINNTISYFWVSDVHNRQYAIPNYLTARLINIRISGTF